MTPAPPEPPVAGQATGVALSTSSAPVPRAPPIWTLLLALVLSFLVAAIGMAAVLGGAALRDMVAAGADLKQFDPVAWDAAYRKVLGGPFGSNFMLWFSAAVWAAFAVGGARLGTREVGKRLGLARRSRVGEEALCILLGMVAIGQIGTAVSRLSAVEPGPALKLLSTAVDNAGWTASGIGVVAGLVAVGIGEELFFRGFLQVRLIERWGGGGVLASAAAFALVHFDKVHSANAFAWGLLLGWSARHLSSIVPGLVAHALNNFAAVTVYPWLPAPAGVGGNVVLLTVCAGAISLAVWALKARRPSSS